MSYEQKDNTGAIFKNDKREKETHPQGKGSALIGGVEYWISAWTNESAKGKYQSLKFERKDAKASKPIPQSSGPMDDMPDDIPFASCDVSHDLETRLSRRMRRYD